MKNAIVFGATSEIAESTINKLAALDYNLFLSARNLEQLDIIAKDVNIKHPKVAIKCYQYESNYSYQKIEELLNEIFNDIKKIDLILIAHGKLPDQDLCVKKWDDFDDALCINGISPLKICHAVSLKMREQKYGTIAVITSVAGLRGRQSNYAYGTAKGMLNIYLQGLRNELSKYNVQVLTIIPGFVDTKMTRDFKKGILWAKPSQIAGDIVNAITKKKDIMYTPWFWKYIMFIIKIIPERLFKKLKL